MPCCPLDGELWAGRGNFQLCRSICGGDTPDPRFMDKIVYAVYSSPPLASVFSTGEIKNTNMVRAMDFHRLSSIGFASASTPSPSGMRACPCRSGRLGDDFTYMPPGVPFEDELQFLNANLDNGPGSKCYLHRQTKLFDIPREAAAQVEAFLQRVLDLGGEGVVVRNPRATWTPKRHRDILKYKPFKDAEARIIGFTSGRETTKGSKHLGRIGALITEYDGKRLELSGLTDAEREFSSAEMGVFASANPGRGHARLVPRRGTSSGAKP